MRGRERTRARIRFPELTFVSSTALRGCAYLQSGVAFEAGRGNAHVDSEDHACTYLSTRERERERKKEREKRSKDYTHTTNKADTHNTYTHPQAYTDVSNTGGGRNSNVQRAKNFTLPALLYW